MNEDSLSSSTQPPSPPAPADVSAEEVRRQHINHETSVKSFGLLYLFAGSFIILMGVIGTVANRETHPKVRITIAAILISLGLFLFLVGTGIRKLKSWARIPAGIFSGIGLILLSWAKLSTEIFSGINLILFPLVTGISAYILYLVFCKKGSTVFSPQYQRVIADTPQIKYKISIIVWIIFVLFVSLSLVALMLYSITRDAYIKP